MAHELDELAPGVHAFVSAREHAWHTLGTVLEDTFTAEEAMKAAYLGGWNVRKAALTAAGGIEVPDRFATVRTNPVTKKTEYLAVVGSSYVPIQNEEHAEFLNILNKEGGSKFETAGALRGGKETFLSMKLPQQLLVGKEDPVDEYVVALNSHDGQSAFRFMLTPIRVVCANTQAQAIGAAKMTFKIRHASTAAAAVEEARTALGMAEKYMALYAEQAEKLIAATATEKQAKLIFDKLFNVKAAKTKRSEELRTAHVDGMMLLLRESPTLEHIKDTKWGVYQSVTEYIDHVMPIRAGTEQARALRAIHPDTMVLKGKALKLVLA